MNRCSLNKFNLHLLNLKFKMLIFIIFYFHNFFEAVESAAKYDFSIFDSQYKARKIPNPGGK